jgi:hypothetical protein
MDEISQGGDDRLPPKRPRWLIAVALAGVVAAAAAFAVTRGGEHEPAAAPPPASATPSRTLTPSPDAVPGGLTLPVVPNPDSSAVGSVRVIVSAGSQEIVMPNAGMTGQLAVLACQSAIWGRMSAGWRAGSLRVGPLWLIGGTHDGYVHLGRGKAAGGKAPARTGPDRTVEMFVHVDAGSDVLMQVTTGAGRYFRFLNGAGVLNAGDRNVIFTSCPASHAGARDLTDYYEVGFSITPGHTASVEVWTLKLPSRPVWITFTAPTGTT